MFRVSIMNENSDFANFGEVWARVTESSEDISASVSDEAAPAEKICIVKYGDKSRAVRFIPEI